MRCVRCLGRPLRAEKRGLGTVQRLREWNRPVRVRLPETGAVPGICIIRKW